jgi:hypothetical protein
MSTLLGSPKLAEGANAGFDLYSPAAGFIIFRCPPVTLTRTLGPLSVSVSSGPSPADRVRDLARALYTGIHPERAEHSPTQGKRCPLPRFNR